MILDTFPTAEEFYKTYWGKKPFIVRGFIPPEQIENFIDGDTLAGLALEEDIKSRIVTNAPAGDDWTCEHGPFDEDRFATLGDRDWSLLVQNVEQYHTDTAQLLAHFQFSPRWLIDDVMVSYSAPGGSVGPHTDSYHTFLVQGIGKRSWKISAHKINDDCYVDNSDMKILQNGFDGETFEVSAGDVIYMPPFFGHEGKTIEAAMTFSVGFLGPKTSEILGEYAQYLEENENLNTRFLGDDLNTKSASFNISKSIQDEIRNGIVDALQTDDFSRWLASYFSVPTYEDVENIDLQENTLSQDDMRAALQNGETLYRPDHVKLTITTSKDGSFFLAVYGQVFVVPAAGKKVIKRLNEDDKITFYDCAEVTELMTALCNMGVVCFSNA